MKNLVAKIKKLGFRLGIKKLLGYEAIFTWAYRKCELGEELYQDMWNDTPFTLFPHSDEYWYADPLIFNYNGQEAVFIECLNRRTGRGAIGVAEIIEGETPEVQIIVEENFHMSFPYIFEWNDELYMIPETEMNNSLLLYSCEQFPYKWKKVGEYLPGYKIVDSIAEKITENKVYFLASEYKKENDFYTRFCRYEMYLDDKRRVQIEYKGQISEEYTLDSRMAGPLINNNLLPVQRSTSGIYGYSVEFKKWDNGEIRECIKEVLPSEIRLSKNKIKPIGIHTYSKSEKYEVIDIQYLVFNKNKWKKRLLKNERKG